MTDKKDVDTYGHTYILRNISHKKNEILPFATTEMDLEDIILNKSDRE